MLRIKIRFCAAVAFTEQVSQELAMTGWREVPGPGEEKGPAPIY